ncbi:LysR family transcriptional regulator [Achromobacter sp. AGC78]
MISNIRERDLRGVDLNLLVTLLVLLRERSVSKAAQCLYLGQPAVSGALARLRELFQDDLLVRTQGGMLPTPRGLELQSQLLPVLAEMQSVILQTPTFDAARSERRFTIGVMDWANDWLLPGLLARLAAQAPHVRLTVLATDRFRFADMLQQEEIDLAVGPFSTDLRWQRSEMLATVPYCCVARAGICSPPRTLPSSSIKAATMTRPSGGWSTSSNRSGHSPGADRRCMPRACPRRLRSPPLPTAAPCAARRWSGRWTRPTPSRLC